MPLQDLGGCGTRAILGQKKVPLRTFPEKDVIKTRFILNLYLEPEGIYSNS